MTKLVSKENLKEVISGLNNGFIVAFPTDTVYGIGVLCKDLKAAERMKVAKKRPETKPFPVMVASLEQLEEIAYLTDRERKIVKHFTPGALTIIVKKKDVIKNDLDTIAIRIPADEYVLNLLNNVGPMFVTSANLSNEPACNNDQEVMQQLAGRIDLVVMGDAKSHVASTIIDCTQEKLVLLRQGDVKLEDIEEILKEKGENKMLHVLDHPLIKHKLTIMRKTTTGTKEFRQNLDEIAGLMAYEISKDLPLKDLPITTPMGDTIGKELDRDVVLVPILRAGLGMVNGIQELIPTAKVGHVGLYRDETTLEPQTYYCKFPPNIANSVVLVCDPMLATGGSAVAAINYVKKAGAKSIKLVCLVGVQNGIDAVMKAHPDVDIFLAAQDEYLNEIGYIVPGLGDAGDRIFGTK